MAPALMQIEWDHRIMKPYGFASPAAIIPPKVMSEIIPGIFGFRAPKRMFQSQPLFGSNAYVALADPIPWEQVKLEARLTLNGMEATDSMLLSAADCKTPKDMMYAVYDFLRTSARFEHLLTLFLPHFFNEKCPRKFLLQGGVSSKRSDWYTVVKFDDTRAYHHWLEKHVMRGTHAVRRVEIHFSDEYTRDFVETIDGRPLYKRAKMSPTLRKYIRLERDFEERRLNEQWNEDCRRRENRELPPVFDEDKDRKKYWPKELPEAIPTS